MTAPRGLHLHVDCPSGAAGDMMLGALIDLGVPVDVIGDALDAIGAGRGRLRVARVVKGGIAAVDVKVDTGGALAGVAAHSHGHAHGHEHEHEHEHDHGHAHEHEHPYGHAHPHYHYADIRRRIADAALTAGTRRIALDIFDRIARAEAKLHGTTVDHVALHEVGAIDSDSDVVGTGACLHWLAPARVSLANVRLGHGRSVVARRAAVPPGGAEVLTRPGVMAIGPGRTGQQPERLFAAGDG